MPVLKLFKKLIQDEKCRSTVQATSGSSKTNNEWRKIGDTTWGDLLPELKKPEFDLAAFYVSATRR